MGPEGGGTSRLSNIAGESAEGLLVTRAEELRSGPGEQTDCGCHQKPETRSSSAFRVDHLRRAAIVTGGSRTSLTIRRKSPNT